MRQPPPIRRYTLAQLGTRPRSRTEEGLRRLKLVRMEEIAAAERERERSGRGRL